MFKETMNDTKDVVEASHTELLDIEDIHVVECKVWDALVKLQHCPYKTVKGLEYTYEIKGNEIFFDRKSKSVTRASVNKALETVIQLRNENIKITGPKKLGCFGASYLYPVFKKIGVL